VAAWIGSLSNSTVLPQGDLKALGALFRVSEAVRTAGLVNFGHVALDGTKISEWSKHKR